MIEVKTIDVGVVPSGNLSKVLYSRELIKNLAAQLVAGQVEGHLEMMSDFPSEYQTFVFADGCIQGAKESVVDYVEDLLSEFRDSLYAEIRNTVIETKSVEISKDGFVGAVVVVG